jgi:hypothetical protein
LNTGSWFLACFFPAANKVTEVQRTNLLSSLLIAEEFVVGSLNLTVEWNGTVAVLEVWWGLRRLSEEEEASLPGFL